MEIPEKDKLLIEGCLKNDRKSQQQLYDRFASKMLALCMRYTHSQEEAEDIMIESFMKVFSSLQYYRCESSLEGWIRKIMINTAITHFRKNEKMQNCSFDDVSYEAADARILSPEEKFAEKDLLKLIQKMPAGYQVIFNLFAIEGYSHKEIAEQLSITESTSKSQFFRARKWLMERIKNE